MRIDEPTRDDVRWVAELMRQRDIDEFLAVGFAENHEALIPQLVERYGNGGDTYCAYLGDDPVAIGAMALHRPGVLTAGLFATEDFPSVAPPFAKFIRSRLMPKYQAAGIHRIDAIASADNADGHRWMKALGMKEEAILRKFGRGGEDFVMYSWIAE